MSIMVNYGQCDYNGKNIIINREIISPLKKLDTVIFDCDGVLLKTDESYDKAIQETVNYIFFSILNRKVPPLVSLEDILLMRNTGGFNNDWELAYAFILYYFYVISNYLSKRIQVTLPKTLDVREAIGFLPKMLPSLNLVNLAPDKIMSLKEHSIKDYLSYLDVSGLRTSRKVLYAWAETMVQIQFMQKIEEFLKFQKGLELDLVTRVFQEFYLGDLIKKFYNVDSILGVKEGLIGTEKLNGKIEEYRHLKDLGVVNLAIASSRPRKEAEFVLKRERIVPDLIDIGASIFLEDIKREEERIERQTGQRISLEKPNPAPIIASLLNMGNVQVLAYVGDTAADIYAANAAKKIVKSQLISVGLTAQASNISALEKKFISLKTDIIVPSISEFITIIDEIKTGSSGVLKKCEALI